MPQREVELLQQINEGLPASVQSRLQELVDQRQKGELTTETQQELIDLMVEVEERDAQRIPFLPEPSPICHPIVLR